MDQKPKSFTGLYVILSVILLFILGIGAFLGFMLFNSSGDIENARSKISSLSGEVDSISDSLTTLDQNVSKIQTETQSEEKAIKKEVKKTGTELVDLDKGWKKYINHDLGFQVEIPGKTDTGELKYQEGKSFTYFYYDQFSEDLYNENIAKGGDDFEKVSGLTYAFLVTDAANDKDLDDFVAQKFGDTCSYGGKQVSENQGMYDIMVIPDDPEKDFFDEGACVLNYIFQIRYSEKLSKVVAWDVGQDAGFYIDGEIVDDRVNNSFTFIK